jgi:hypothetical protein
MPSVYLDRWNIEQTGSIDLSWPENFFLLYNAVLIAVITNSFTNPVLQKLKIVHIPETTAIFM